MGWRHADDALARMIGEAGHSYEVVPVRIGATGRLRRTLALTDLIEARAARRAGAQVTAQAAIYSSTTAALLQRPRVPYAVRFDTLAAMSRPGICGTWQRAREPAALKRASVLLPWSETATRVARELVADADPAPAIVTLPVPIELVVSTAGRDIDAVAYAANPRKRGLDLLCRTWRLAGGGRLVVGGIEREAALRYLRKARVDEPPGIEWAGPLSREEWLDRVGRARVFVNASRYEDWGIAQLEALALGTPLVSVESEGPNEALAIARHAGPQLIASEPAPEALAAAIRAGLALPGPDRVAYANTVEPMLAPYRPDAVRRVLTEEALPALLRSSS